MIEQSIDLGECWELVVKREQECIEATVYEGGGPLMLEMFTDREVPDAALVAAAKAFRQAVQDARFEAAGAEG